MARSIFLQTAKAAYYVTTDKDGLSGARFQSINKKTGLPWQAMRGVPGTDVVVLSDYKSNTSKTIEATDFPANWSEDGKWNGASKAFSSRAVAEAACRKHAGL